LSPRKEEKMQRVVRKTKDSGYAQKWKTTRGPFLTESTVFDGGNRPLVVTLHGEFIEFRQKGRRKGVLILDYSVAWAYALRRQMEERARAKKAAKKTAAGGVR
jgi:hypothetical protein